ncbi:MAG: ribbon-helix-helix protein, CopG family [Lawsonibacter sp.]|nr:ribbon-helix-helix protein, CopG family [Lawsonibacter sp.]
MWPKAKVNTERVSTFLSVEHLEALKREAERNGTNVSALIRMIILEYLAEK